MTIINKKYISMLLTITLNSWIIQPCFSMDYRHVDIYRIDKVYYKSKKTNFAEISLMEHEKYKEKLFNEYTELKQVKQIYKGEKCYYDENENYFLDESFYILSIDQETIDSFFVDFSKTSKDDAKTKLTKYNDLSKFLKSCFVNEDKKIRINSTQYLKQTQKFLSIYENLFKFTKKFQKEFKEYLTHYYSSKHKIKNMLFENLLNEELIRNPEYKEYMEQQNEKHYKNITKNGKYKDDLSCETYECIENFEELIKSHIEQKLKTENNNQNADPLIQ